MAGSPTLTCGCGAVLHFDESRGWPKSCGGCGAGVLAPLPGPQTVALGSPADVIFFGGGVFGGKSFGAALFARKYVHRTNATILVMRQERKMLLGSGALLSKFKSVMGDLRPLIRESSMHVDMRFPVSGASVEFAGCRTPSDFRKYEGNEYSVIIWDEAQQLEFATFLKMMQRNRSPGGCDVVPRMFLTGNPPQPGEPGYWLRELIDWFIGPDGFPIADRCGKLRYFTVNDNQIEWVDPGWRDEDGNPPKSFTFIQALATDNPVGLADNPTYMASIRAQTEVDQERLAKGNWDAKHGARLFGHGRIEWLPRFPLEILSANTVRYWDLGGGMNDTDTRNGLGSFLVTIALCPKCDGHRFLGDAPCPVCNVMPDGKGGVVPFRELSQVQLDNKDGPRKGIWLRSPIWEQGELGELEKTMIDVTRADGPDIPQYIEQEKGSGKVATHHYQELLTWSDVFGDPVSGKKQVRAKPLVSAADVGLLFVERSELDTQVRRAFASFGPDGSGEFKDLIDAGAGGVKVFWEHEFPPKIAWRM